MNKDNVLRAMELGRNELCWCGSGKKYKKCHMLLRSKPESFGVRTQKISNAKTASELDGMRRAGAFNGQLLDYIRGYIKPGISSGQIDRLVHAYTLDHGHRPATLGYRGYSKSCCVSINDVVCHGVPRDDVFLKEGDIVNVDVTTIVDGWYGDQSETFLIGQVHPAAKQLVAATAEALLAGIDSVKPGATLNAIGKAVERIARRGNYSIIRDYTGHGIGKEFHEGYSVFHYPLREAEAIVLEPGMTFTIEPMLNIGDWHTYVEEDGWTVRTRDGKLSAQFEHTVAVTETGVEILTLTPTQRAVGKRLIIDGIGAFD